MHIFFAHPYRTILERKDALRQDDTWDPDHKFLQAAKYKETIKDSK